MSESDRRPERSHKPRVNPLTVIGAFKLVQAVSLLALGFVTLRLVHRDVAAVITRWVKVIHGDPNGRALRKVLTAAFSLDDRKLRALGVALFVYAVLFSIEGVGGLPPAFPLNAIRGVAMGHFDGKGNYTQVDHIVAGGAPPPVEWTFGSGPYTVHPNCTGTLVINIPGSPFSPVRLHFVVVRQCKEIRTVVDSGSASTSIGIKVE